MKIPDLEKLYKDMAESSPALRRGIVWCRTCGGSRKVDSAACLRGSGWPVCCGETMTLDRPEGPA